MATVKPALPAQRSSSSSGIDQPRDSGDSGQYVDMAEGDTQIKNGPNSESQKKPTQSSNITKEADLEERRRRPLPNTWQQCCVIVYHAWLIKFANKTSTILELLLPIITVGFGLIIPLLTDVKLSSGPKAAPNLVTPNFSRIYSYDPVVVSGAPSYLAHGSFVPISKLLVAPNSPTTMKVATSVFQCVLELAGYTRSDGSDTWTSAAAIKTSVDRTFTPDDGSPPIEISHPLKTSYVLDASTIIGFSNPDDAVKAINAGSVEEVYNYYWQNQAPVALIFDDAAVQAPSYALHFKYEAYYPTAKYGTDTRLPDASPLVDCQQRPIGLLPGEQIEQECYGAYSDCTNDFDCKVSYDQRNFLVPTEYMCSSDKYMFSGAAALQLCVDREIIRLHAKNPLVPIVPKVSTRAMPRQIEKIEPHDGNLDSTAFFVMIGCSGFTTIFVVWLVMLEKERKLKQMLHMVGVTPTAYWLGWFVGYVTICAVTGFILWLMLFLSSSSPLHATDGWMLLLIIYMAGINAIVMGFLFVSLFSRAVTAVLCTVTYVFAIAIVYNIVSAYIAFNGCVSNGTFWGLSIFGNYAFMLAVARMSYITKVKGETTWDNFTLVGSSAMSIGEAFMMQIIDTIIYALLAYYFDQVLPNEHRARRHPLFFLGPSFWRTLFTSNDHIKADEEKSRNATREVLTELNANPDVESVDISVGEVEHVGIVTQKLCKDFNTSMLTSADDTKKLAVDNLSLAVYKNEITAILGHNGAGKTTTIRMLTGQIRPTEGTAYILNHNIHTDKGRRAVQATLGLTAQDNILWPTLTIAQHLQIFGRLKNMTKREIEVNSLNLLDQLDLLVKVDERSSTLSGGQKRRLCLALALIGDPQIVFLDEPSCGVDPQSRRKMWDTLISYKASDKCIVLTTHSMYEADVLADRKLIVSKGKLRCAGSSVFLKNRFGVGYNLNIELDPQRSVADRQKSIQGLTQQISATVPNATFPQSYGTNYDHLEVQLPKNEMDKYGNLFVLLEGDNATNMGLTDIGVSMVSLEEVFLRLSKEDEKSVEKRESIREVAEIGQAPITYWTKFAALLRIRYILWKRRPWRYLVAIIISILLVFISAYFEELFIGVGVNQINKEIAHEQSKSKIPVDLHQYQATIFSSPNDPLIIRAQNNDDYKSATQVLPAMGIQQYTQLPATNTYNDLIAYGLAQADRAYYYAGADIAAWPRPGLPIQAEYTVWYNSTFVHSLPLAMNVINSMLYKTLVSSESSPAAGITTKIYQQSFYSNVTKISQDRLASNPFVQGIILLMFPVLLTIALSFFTSVLIADAVYDKQTGAIRLLRLSNACGSLYWLPMVTVHLITYWLPVLVAFVIFFNVWTTHFIAYNSMTVFTFILHTFLFVLVMTILAYCASLLFKKVSSAMTANEIVSLAAAVGTSVAAGMIIQEVLNEFMKGGVVANSGEAKSVQTLSFIFPWWSYAAGLSAIGVSFIIRTLNFPSRVPIVWNAVTWNELYVAAFIGLLLWLFISLLILVIAEMFNSGIAQSFMAKFVFSSTTKSRMREQLELDNKPQLFKPENVAEDEDVRGERQLSNKSVAVLIENLTTSDVEAPQSLEPVPAITALHLQKRYGQSLRGFMDNFNASASVLAGYYANTDGCAVRNVSFRVQPNEIFGLLGPNGAGKTTIMSMLVNETHPTAGLIYVDRYNTLTQRQQATNLLGYCPQFDALWDEVTVVEHLELMAALHGQQANMMSPNGLIIRMAAQLGLQEHWNKKSKQLSGGTKRKLSFLISIIDRNMTSLLDEPSSGMDPGSARYLWDIIKHHFKNRPKTNEVSVGGILTTHYMEEAEALCDRIAIMVKGTVRCIGTSTHLRNKFGSGYRLELRLVDAQETTRRLATDTIMAQFSEAILKKNESRLNRLVFSLPQKQALPLSKSFAFLESQRRLSQSDPSTAEPAEANENRKVVEYTITQASIEHVFLRIVGNQEDVEEEKDAVM